ncbi:hypothetical protein DIPPA_25019 [Diplonema papillatum]|nr:hypothetical protein DIPPA_25019 [Diplonema papillatum]KAJ9447767.1 hypothetical protein DIPPA_25019 [Diplonema papillatum]|eukprot:gene13086-20185_t
MGGTASALPKQVEAAPKVVPDNVPEDPFLRSALLAFQNDDTDAADREQVAAIEPSIAAASAEQDMRLHRFDQNQDDGQITIEDTAGQLFYRRLFHLTAAVGSVYIVPSLARYVNNQALVPGQSTLRAHGLAFGGLMVCYMAYYHSSRYTELGELMRQIERREKMRALSHAKFKRSGFIYQPVFTIPERKL